MRLSSLFIIFLFSQFCENISACNAEATEKVKSTPTLLSLKTCSISTFNVQKKDIDIIELDSLRIKELPLYLNKKDFYENWTKPDSITSMYAECGYLKGKTIKQYYFNGAIFLVYDNRAELSEINFETSDLIIEGSELTLSKNTILSEFDDKYESSYQQRGESFYNNASYVTLRFRVHKDWDEYIHLLFKNDKLIQFIIWNPC